MTAILIKTIIIYIILLLTMRILGKRQLGELEVSELITTILISEIASMPIANQDIPISHAIIPLITITAFEICISFLQIKFPNLKNILSSPPSTLIKNGKINQDELNKNRISAEELISELRLKNITDISQVRYAILEQNGLLSVIPKIEHQQPTLKQLSITESDTGIFHIIISQGTWNNYNLRLLKIEKSHFEDYLKKKHLHLYEIFLLTIDDDQNISIVVKERYK